MIDSVKNAITPSKTRRILSLALCAACVILFLRYYHYSLLKYKYSYEDQLNEEQVR